MLTFDESAVASCESPKKPEGKIMTCDDRRMLLR